MVAQLKSRKQIISLVNGCLKMSEAFYDKVHEALIQCLLHVEAHGDTTPLARLYAGLGKRGTYEGGIAKWLMVYSPVRVNGDGEIKLLKKSNETLWAAHLTATGGRIWCIEDADNNQFWTLAAVKAAKKAKDGDKFFAIVELARKQFRKALDEDQFDGDPVAVREYLAALGAVPKPVQQEARWVRPTVLEQVSANLANDTVEAEEPAVVVGFDTANVQDIAAA